MVYNLYFQNTFIILANIEKYRTKTKLYKNLDLSMSAIIHAIKILEKHKFLSTQKINREREYYLTDSAKKFIKHLYIIINEVKKWI